MPVSPEIGSGVKVIVLPGKNAEGTGAHPVPFDVPTQGTLDVGKVIVNPFDVPVTQTGIPSPYKGLLVGSFGPPRKNGVPEEQVKLNPEPEEEFVFTVGAGMLDGSVVPG